MTRDPYLDNAKFLAIVLVVAGHAIEGLRDVHAAQAIYLFLYLFHMPVFVALAGHLSKTPRARKLITGVALPYVIFEIAYDLAFRHGIALLTPYWLLWFLMALFLWRLSTPVWQQLRHPVAVAVVIALLAGAAAPGGVLSLNRVLGFLPFYVLGLSLEPAHFERLRRLRVPGAIVLGTTLAAAFTTRMPAEWTYWRYGNAHFHTGALDGTLIRAGLLVTEAVLTAAFLAIVPARRTWFSPLGASTLYAYLLHGFVIRLTQHLWPHTTYGVALAATTGAVLALVLCLPPIRTLTRWAVEPRMNWVFTPTHRQPATSRSSA
jgi:fucose 4-O-acetylase-like acetyltransferase